MFVIYTQVCAGTLVRHYQLTTVTSDWLTERIIIRKGIAVYQFLCGIPSIQFSYSDVVPFPMPVPRALHFDGTLGILK